MCQTPCEKSNRVSQKLKLDAQPVTSFQQAA